MLAPDILVLAADLDEESGWLTCDKITRELPRTKVFLVADSSEAQNHHYASFVGAAGLLDPTQNLQSIVQEVCGHTVHAAG
jgi:DNA-binding NarL/FixJ family response regulator